MGAFKAPSVDGFPLAFFQEFWDIVGFDVTTTVRDILRMGKLLK